MQALWLTFLLALKLAVFAFAILTNLFLLASLGILMFPAVLYEKASCRFPTRSRLAP